MQINKKMCGNNELIPTSPSPVDSSESDDLLLRREGLI